MTCPKCGIEIAAGARFCNNCGAPIPADVQEAANAAYEAQAEGAAAAQEAVGTPQQAAQPTNPEKPGRRTIELPIEYKPITPWGYFGYNLLFAIPLVGLVFMIVYSLGGTKNKNLKNYARSQFIWLILAVIIAIIAAVIYLIGAGRG